MDVDPSQPAGPVAFAQSQKSLTTGLDTHSWDQQLQASSLTPCATLRSEAEPGARAFLAAAPSGRKHMDCAVFLAELRHRLCIAEAAADEWCPKCNGLLIPCRSLCGWP